MTAITVFACTRTNLADKKLPDAARLVQVPCTGRISIPLLLGTIARGSDGVLVLGRHQETCRLRGAEDPARRRSERAAELLGMLGFGSGRVRFANPEPGLQGPSTAVEQFARSIARLGPKPNSTPLPETVVGAEGLDTSVELVRWFAAHRGVRTDLGAWLRFNDLPESQADDPVLVAGIVPFLDRMADSLLRPVGMPAQLRAALSVLARLGVQRPGVFPEAWVVKGSEGARALAGRQLFTLCESGKRILADAGLPSTILADLLRDKAEVLPRPPNPARVAVDAAAGQSSLVQALGYEPVDVGPDPLPAQFSLTPESRALAERRLAAAESAGASALFVPGPLSLARWAMFTRHGTWQSARVVPVMAHVLAQLSYARTPLTVRSLENPLAGSREVAS